MIKSSVSTSIKMVAKQNGGRAQDAAEASAGDAAVLTGPQVSLKLTSAFGLGVFDDGLSKFLDTV